MQKQEFEERIERTVTDEQYKVIEEVYMWHPSIRNTSGKDEVAELYKSFGMTIFHDMLPRAKKAHELDEFLRNAQREVQRIQEEIEELSCPTIAEVNSSWGIKNPFFFQKKVFYWGTKEEQKEIYVLEEGETILSLNKYGDLWEAETIAIPWIHHSQEVEVQHSKYSGIVTVEKTIVRSDDTGAVHMYIYFAGGEKDV